MSELPPELVDRMVALITTLASKAPAHSPESWEAAAIFASFPVAPDLIEVREIANRLGKASAINERLPAIAKGLGDTWFETRFALAALQRGRELEREEAALKAPLVGEQG